MKFELEPELVSIKGIKGKIKIYRHTIGYVDKYIKPIQKTISSLYEQKEPPEDNIVNPLLAKTVAYFIHDSSYELAQDDVDELIACLGSATLLALFYKCLAVNSGTEQDAKKD